MNVKLPKGQYSENFLKFFDWALKYLDKHGKKLEIHNSAFLKKGGRCGGYFDGEKIVVAGKSTRFVETFLHEHCHCMQSVEEKPELTFEDYWDGDFGIDHFHYFLNLILIERDCEARVVRLSKKWGLINESDYNRRANSYLFFHHYMFLKKKWIASYDLYDESILKHMPEKIVPASKLKNIDMDLMLVYDEVINKKTRPLN